MISVIEKLNGIGSQKVLNSADYRWLPVHDLDIELAAQMRDLKRLFYNVQQFDYPSMQHSEQMHVLGSLVSRLHHFDPSALSDAGRQRAFWINLYNLLILHGVIALKVRNSVLEKRAFFSRIAYRVNGLRFSANDIEHGVLRGNAGHPYIPGKAFTRRDARQRYVLPPDPRIHFALNCASHSCPPIAAYRGEELDQQLNLAARAFINGGGVDVDLAVRRLTVSAIFNWYRHDFVVAAWPPGSRSSIILFIAGYVADDHTRQQLQEAPGQFRVRYQPYDWRLNRLAV